MTKLELRNVTKGFEANNGASSVTALENINLNIERGTVRMFCRPIRVRQDHVAEHFSRTRQANFWRSNFERSTGSRNGTR